MLWLIILFCGFLALLARAPADTIKLGLTLLWGLMALGCAASVASSLAPGLLS